VRRSDLDADPLRQFARWVDEARTAGVAFPDVMTLATATRGGRPSARQVLLKDFDEHGFVFFTGRGSRKGRDLAENPHAALLFHFAPAGRQVRIEGPVEPVERDEVADYWQTRPLGSRLSAAASRQTEPIGSREELEARVEELRAEGEPPLPDHWGGYRVVPEEYEFWQHRDDRLHDRFRYRLDGPAWTIERLSP
jgi:pyridoxamine 5'-phosphate oxidase